MPQTDNSKWVYQLGDTVFETDRSQPPLWTKAQAAKWSAEIAALLEPSPKPHIWIDDGVEDDGDDREGMWTPGQAQDQEPVPLDADLLELARGAQTNIIQEIYQEQARRDALRQPEFGEDAEFEESKHPRDKGGKFTSKGGQGGGGAAAKGEGEEEEGGGTFSRATGQQPHAAPHAASGYTSAARAKAQQLVSAVAGPHATPDQATAIMHVVADAVGYPKNKVKAIAGKNPTFYKNGKTYGTAANTDKNGDVVLWAEANSPSYIAGVAAHEIMHGRWGFVRRAVAKKADAGEELTPDEQTIHDEPWAPELEEDDGCTSYSRDYWNFVKKTGQGRRSAVHETLAEMSLLDWIGKLKGSPWYENSEHFRPLYDAVTRYYPTLEGSKSTGGGPDPDFTAESKLPAELNGVPFTKFTPPEDWNEVAGQKPDLEEPPLEAPPGKHISTGLIMQEPDGRVWVVKPSGGFGGYHYTFPKGTQEEGMSLQATAIKEAFEESGLHGEITGFAGDFPGDTSLNRYYLARRVGGRPTDYGWESEGVSLVAPEDLHNYLNRDRDRHIAASNFPGAVPPAPAAPPSPPPAAQTPPDLQPAAQASKPTIGEPIDHTKMKKTGGQLGSNTGGQFTDQNGNKYYVKFAKGGDPDHAKNELLAAALYDAAGSRVLKYHPLASGNGIATEWQDPDKKGGLSSFTPEEWRRAQDDFATHAWLANWDAVGTGYGGDNQSILGGEPITNDVGGSLIYRAQGAPKGKLFGDTVGEWDTMRDKDFAPAKPGHFSAGDLYGDMTPDQLRSSVAKVAKVSDEKIRELVEKHGPLKGDLKAELAQTLINRRNDLIAKAAEL